MKRFRLNNSNNWIGLTLSCNILFLCACGGGGGGSSDNQEPPPPPPPPVIIDDGLPPVEADRVDPTEMFSGGQASVDRDDEDAYSQSAPAVTADFTLDANFKSGNQLFRNTHNGQGPLMNTATCQGCHVKDGRGHIPESVNEPMDAMFLKISSADDQNEMTYGGQIQTFGVASFEGNDPSLGLPRYNGALLGDGAIGEAFAFIEYEEIPGEYPDGQSYSLRNPTYRLKDLSYGPISAGIKLSPRVAPPMFGLGLLGAIPSEDIEALADPQDSDGDGISGRTNHSIGLLTTEMKLGRFGSKALTTSVLHQSVGAYRGDMGITTSLTSEESCTTLQQACIDKAEQESNNGENGTDITNLELALVEFYSRTLAVPQRRGFDQQTETWQADIWQGRQKFFEANCTACHVPRHQTGEAAGSILGEIGITSLTPDAVTIESLSEQIIWPYTDMLLHDMGGSCDEVVLELPTGESCSDEEMCQVVLRCQGLADGRNEGQANGTEWRTSPLWGIGLAQTVNPRANFLHDGRARTLEEAILWHAGEAETAKDQFMNMSAADRESIIAFLQSM